MRRGEVSERAPRPTPFSLHPPQISIARTTPAAMRIRRRPQALIPSPLQLHQASDPSQPPDSSGNLQHRLPQKELNFEPPELHSHRPNVDLREDPSPASRGASSPQGNNVVERSRQNQIRGGAQRQGGNSAHGHGSLENGDHDGCDQCALINAGEERLATGVFVAMPLASMSPLSVKEGIMTDSPKRRRKSAVLLEGSRCSRVNGRGWRCSQPTLVGYSLCEHHLGKGRQSRSSRAGGAMRSTGSPKLGRTEPSVKKSVALLALAAAAADANQPAAHLTAEFS